MIQPWVHAMKSVVIDRRFQGPPTSGNGGYVCGVVAGHIEGSAEITLRAPPPLDRPLDVVIGADGAVELREKETLLATGALLGPGGKVMAVARTIWVIVDRAIVMGEGR